MANEYFTDEEMKENNITDYIYKEINEKFMAYDYEKINVWDYRENHKRFRNCLNARKEGKSIIFKPYLPMFISEPITKDNLFKK